MGSSRRFYWSKGDVVVSVVGRGVGNAGRKIA